jgi:hypothetical protein|nr:MAG TPA: KNOX2 domain [Caudoviricetes sp.]
MYDTAYNNKQGVFVIENDSDLEKFKEDMQRHLDALLNMCNNISQVY